MTLTYINYFNSKIKTEKGYLRNFDSVLDIHVTPLSDPNRRALSKTVVMGLRKPYQIQLWYGSGGFMYYNIRLWWDFESLIKSSYDTAVGDFTYYYHKCLYCGNRASLLTLGLFPWRWSRPHFDLKETVFALIQIRLKTGSIEIG